jgi:hypothetical protein
MYREIQKSINQSFTTNSRCIATPSPRAFPGNRHAAPIMFRMVGAAFLLSVYLYVSHTEAFLWRVMLVILNDYDAALVLNSRSIFRLLFIIV